MANSEILKIILELQDNASKELGKISGNLQKLKPTFKKMAVAGTIAMGAVALGVKGVVEEAGIAEGAIAKFNTVFGDGKDDMMDFIDTLRKEMPTATTDIVQMASGVQDLLVPMGLARDESKELTKEFLDLSNKIGAFGDKKPEDVLEAIKSGLVGSSEPLRQYGVDARVSALEQTALNEGLLEAGETLASLEPSIRSQITAQALLAQITNQSADAINGFEENNDSFIRRQQELNASIKETKIAIGNALLPIMDSLLKKILPIIEKLSLWVQEHPKLTKYIIIATGIIAGLVTVIGILGLLLPPLIAGFSALGAIIGLISFPVLAVIAVIMALIAVGVLIWKNWDTIKIKAGQFIDYLYKIFKTFGKWWKTFWESVGSFIVGIWDGIKNGIKSGINWVIDKLNFFVRAYNKILEGLNTVPGVNISAMSEIPKLAKGGIVTKPTLAMIGEAGAEAVIPLNKANQNGFGGGLTINMYGDVNGDDAMDTFSQKIMDNLGLNARLTAGA